MSQQIIDSIRSIISKALRAQTILTSSAVSGQTQINVISSRRFNIGDQIRIRNTIDNSGQYHNIKQVPLGNIIVLTQPIQGNYNKDDTVIQMCYNFQVLQAVYHGKPQVIPKYPSVTVFVPSFSHSPLAIRLNQDKYTVQISIYVQASWQQLAVRTLSRMVKKINQTMKRNYLPLVSPFVSCSIASDINAGDQYIYINNSSGNILWAPAIISLQDPWNWNEVSVQRIVSVDNNTGMTLLKLSTPCAYSFKVQDNSQAIFHTRMIYYNWLDNVSYGVVYKGTLLKSAVMTLTIKQTDIAPNCPQQSIF